MSEIAVTATCVRVPVFRGHSESIYVELSRDFDLDEVREHLRRGAGIVVEDDLEESNLSDTAGSYWPT